MNVFFRRKFGAVTNQLGVCAALVLLLTLTGCATIPTADGVDNERLRETSQLIQDVKAFGKTLAIEPTQALVRTSHDGPALSMLWLWMQRVGTLAMRTPVDIHMAIGFSTERERLRIEQVYRVNGYSVYYRQGSEFADARSVATVGFSDEPIVRRVKVILHEDLHGDSNFDLPWEIEEALVTPLGSLAAVEYFRFKNDERNLANAVASVAQERKLSRELNELVAQAEKIFAQADPQSAKEKILALLVNYPTYSRQFERQVEGQHRATVLEAKLSHDLAYYRYFDRVAELAEQAPGLRVLIEDLRLLPKDANPDTTDNFIDRLAAKYSSHVP